MSKSRGVNGGDRSKPHLSPKVQAEYRAKIDTNLICKKLIGHVKGEVKMEATQIRAAEILLRKCLPDLASISIPY